MSVIFWSQSFCFFLFPDMSRSDIWLGVTDQWQDDVWINAENGREVGIKQHRPAGPVHFTLDANLSFQSTKRGVRKYDLGWCNFLGLV